jgi:hypothetical protein
MTDFSRDPLTVLQENIAERFTGVYFQQGVPILDRDLNLLQDLLAEGLRTAIDRYLGSGVQSGSSAFQITPAGADNDLVIAGSGFCLVGGMEAAITGNVGYSARRAEWGSKELTTPAAGGPATRTDIVYLEVFTEVVEDWAALGNDEDIGVPTTVRQRTSWAVRVDENTDQVPAPTGTRRVFPLARLTRERGKAAITAGMIADLRQSYFSHAKLVELAVLPKIDEIVPREGGVNRDVSIRGRNFHLTPTEVRFGSITLTATGTTPALAVTPNRIDFKVPAGATPGQTPVVLTTAGGTLNTSFKVNPA